jgi:hypothetical protein
MDLSTFQKDIAELGAALAQGLEAQVFGSFSDRNPGLGQMKTCPFCHVRRREFATEKCCNAAHATTQRAWDEEKGFYQAECPPRVVEAPFGKSVIKKMLHKRHGQNRDWHRREITRRMQEDFHFVETAARAMFSRPCLKWVDIKKMLPDATGIPAFAEKYYVWKSSKARTKRG